MVYSCCIGVINHLLYVCLFTSNEQCVKLEIYMAEHSPREIPLDGGGIKLEKSYALINDGK